MRAVHETGGTPLPPVAGCRASTRPLRVMCSYVVMEEIAKMNGPFAVQEYLQELIRNEPANVMKICDLPPEVDESVWQYEHIRQFILELNLLVV